MMDHSAVNDVEVLNYEQKSRIESFRCGNATMCQHGAGISRVVSGNIDNFEVCADEQYATRAILR